MKRQLLSFCLRISEGEHQWLSRGIRETPYFSRPPLLLLKFSEGERQWLSRGLTAWRVTT